MNWLNSTLYIVAIFLAASLLSGCEKFIYSVDINNDGSSGVLVLQAGERKTQRPHPSYEKKGVTIPIIHGLRPGTSGVTTINLFRFTGHDNSLPDEIEVVWQLAELSGCRESQWSRGKIDFRTCHTWTPLPDKVFHKTLDMSAIRETDAYKRTGKRNPNIGSSRYTLKLNLIFNEDQLTVEASNSSTNPWK